VFEPLSPIIESRLVRSRKPVTTTVGSLYTSGSIWSALTVEKNELCEMMKRRQRSGLVIAVPKVFVGLKKEFKSYSLSLKNSAYALDKMQFSKVY
jgi:hypothetical protein